MLFEILVSPPKDWLKGVDTGGWPNVTSKGILFFAYDAVPGVISIALFLLFILSLIFLIVGGIMWITSSGNKEGLAKAKATVTYALVGLALGLSSFLILNTILAFLGMTPNTTVPGSCGASGLGC